MRREITDRVHNSSRMFCVGSRFADNFHAIAQQYQQDKTVVVSLSLGACIHTHSHSNTHTPHSHFAVDSALRHVGSTTYVCVCVCVCSFLLRTADVMFVMRREMASADMADL